MDWNQIFSYVFLVNVLAAGVKLSTPLVLAALGETFAERSGVLNLGIEGMMLVSGFVGFSMAFISGSAWFGVLMGIVCGVMLGLIFAVLTVSLRTDQIVTGLAFMILCSGLAIYIYRIQFSGFKIFPQIEPFRQFSFPLLGQIPFIGKILFNQNILTLLMYLLVPACWIIFTRTRFGLRIASVGEYPAAADAVGIKVPAIRYMCLMIGGGLAGLAGAYFPLAELGFYSVSMIGGRGFIALALVVFGRWNPFYTLLGGLFFGVINAIQIRLQFLGAPIPSQFLIMMPYVLTIVVMLFGKLRRAPASLTVPYVRK